MFFDNSRLKCAKKFLALPDGFLTYNLQLLDRRRQGHLDRLKDLTTNALAFTADGNAVIVFLDGDPLEGFKILFDGGPFKMITVGLESLFKLLAQNERQKAAKDVAPDGFIMVMEDRPGIKQRFDISKNPFHLP